MQWANPFNKSGETEEVLIIWSENTENVIQQRIEIHQVPILCIKWKHLWHNINFNPLITCTGSLLSDKQYKWLGDSADQIV